MGEVFAGRYEFVDVLGHGGMGTVWRVWDLRERQYRAAKVLRQSDSASLLRFVRETATRIDHDHVVAPTGWSAEDDRVLFTMPLVAGGSVATLLADYGPLPPGLVKVLTCQLLDALTAVHAAGIVHRDVKPANLLLDATGQAAPRLRLSDFGIAASPDEPRLTRASEAVHTPGYSSPAAVAGADPEPAQDLYSVAMVMQEMLTGRRPSVGPGGSVPSGPLGPFIDQLLELDMSAADAKVALERIDVDQTSGDEPIEVFEQLPDLPAGWGAGGPGTAEAVPRRSRPPRDAMTKEARLRIAAASLALTGLVCVVVALVLVF